MTKRSKPDHYDALIVGARCAGSATAMLLARAGLKVLLIDREAPGSDTMSTHALMRGAVMQLESWGLLAPLLEVGTPAIRKTTFYYGADRLPLDIAPSHGVDALIAPRRKLLDFHLAAAARAAGAAIRHRTSLRDLVKDTDGRVRGAILIGPNGKEIPVSAGLVIGADGRRSTVARRVGARTLERAQHRTSCLYGYFGGMRDDGYRWYYDTEIAAGAIPTNDGAHCVFAALPDDRFGHARKSGSPQSLLHALCQQAHPELGEELAGATPIGRPVIFAGEKGHIRQSHGPGWALVGDAGYFKDPITAHGITDALRDAEILAQAIVADMGDLSGYQRQRDALSKELFAITDAIASFDWTLPDLQHLHKRLNGTMKKEQAWMQGGLGCDALAA